MPMSSKDAEILKAEVKKAMYGKRKKKPKPKK